MNIEMTCQGDVLIVHVQGEMDLAVTDQLRNQIDRRLEQDVAKHLLFDLAGVSFMDSSGLGLLLGRYKRISKHGGKMVIARVQPSVRRVLELSGIVKIVKIYETEIEALNQLIAS